MNFLSFPIGTITLFPGANGTFGSQLMTEANLLSRETVDTDSRVKYPIGKSFTHNTEDFTVSFDAGSPTVLIIGAGRAIVNGHYFESRQPVSIDLLQANNQALRQSLAPLTGHLRVGLKAIYSTEQTLAGTLLVENKSNMFAGIQIVIEKRENFFVPADKPEVADAGTANADLFLADVQFVDGAIIKITQNPNQAQCIDATRIFNFEQMQDATYVRKTGLINDAFYIMGGNGVWCNSNPSMMIWDANVRTSSNQDDLKLIQSIKEAQFAVGLDGSVSLVVPHKQFEHGIRTQSGAVEYFMPKYIPVPAASFESNTPGVVTAQYTEAIKKIRQDVNNFYNFPKGKQRGFIAILQEGVALPPISPQWEAGDYLLVGQDLNIGESTSYDTGYCTMYVVCPGAAKKFQYTDKDPKSSESGLGLRLGYLEVNESSQGAEPPGAEATSEVVTDYLDQMFAFSTAGVCGVPHSSYYEVKYTRMVDNGGEHMVEDTVTYIYEVLDAGGFQWSSPVVITGRIPMAQEGTIGGFLNAPENFIDQGYIRVDENGHLRLVDYALLRSGTLAYQLGEDFETPKGVDYEEIQAYLNEYVNQRIALPNAKHVAAAAEAGTDPSHITITIQLPALGSDEDYATLNISGIDSRFNTAVILKLVGEATSAVTVNIYDCQKLKIEVDGCTPTVNVYRSNLYYDPHVLNYILTCNRDLNVFTGLEDIQLWYQKFSSDDADLVVDGLTVRDLSANLVPEEVSYWDVDIESDHHLSYALESISFGSNGIIVGAGIYVKDNITTSLADGKSIITAPFVLPNLAEGLWYPQAAVAKAIKISGSFVSAYATKNPSGYMTATIHFTALSQTYNVYAAEKQISGTISFLIDAAHIEAVAGASSGYNLDGFMKNKYHVFRGSVAL